MVFPSLQITTKSQLAIGRRSHQRIGTPKLNSNHSEQRQQRANEQQHQQQPKPKIHISGSEQDDSRLEYDTESVSEECGAIVFRAAAANVAAAHHRQGFVARIDGERKWVIKQ